MALLSVFLTDLIYPHVGHAFRMFSSMISGLHCCNKSVISVWPFKIRGGLAHHNGSSAENEGSRRFHNHGEGGLLGPSLG